MSEFEVNPVSPSPFFTVIIPVHNKANYLEQSLACVYAQTFKDFEIIAVDDCSSDGSLDILKRHESAGKLRLYQRGTPGPGGYAARNFGVTKAHASWVVFFDADDIMHTDHLSNFHDMMKRYPGLRFYCANYERRVVGRVSRKVMEISTGKYSRLEGLAMYSRDDFFHMNSACTQVSLFEELGGFPAGLYRRGGDVYFWVKLLTRVEEFAYSDELTSVWCVDNSSVTKNPSNLALHPMADFMARERPSLDRKCERQLCKIVNRKVISWAAEKKAQGKRYDRDLSHISLRGMWYRDAMRILLLFFPLRLYNFFVEVKRGLVN